METPSLKSSPPPRALLAAGLGLVWALLVAALYGVGFFDGLEDRVLDWEQRLPAAPALDAGLALISIDRVPSDRPWPWPRLDYALLLRGLVPERPQSVVFAMLMHDHDRRFSAFDPAFRDLIRRVDNVTFAAAGLSSGDGMALPDGALSIEAKGNPAGRLPTVDSFYWPVATFAAGQPVGLSNLSAEPGAVYRSLPLLFRSGEKRLPSLVLVAAAERIGADLKRSERIGDEICLRDGSGRTLRRIPIDDEGRMQLRWRRNGKPILRVSDEDFLLDADQMARGVKPATDLREMARRQVWVGLTDRAVEDPIATAAGQKMAVEIEMAATEQIVRDDFVVRVPRSMVIGLFLVTGIALAYVAQHLSLGRAIGVMAGMIGFIAVGAVAAFVMANVAFPVASLGVLGGGILLSTRAARAWDR